jgi:ribosomal protein L32
VERQQWNIMVDNINLIDFSKKRMEICKSCKHFIKIGHICSKCGCLMDLKVKMASKACPIGKWQQEK